MCDHRNEWEIGKRQGTVITANHQCGKPSRECNFDKLSASMRRTAPKCRKSTRLNKTSHDRSWYDCNVMKLVPHLWHSAKYDLRGERDVVKVIVAMCYIMTEISWTLQIWPLYQWTIAGASEMKRIYTNNLHSRLQLTLNYLQKSSDNEGSATTMN